VTSKDSVKGIINDRDLLACFAESHDPHTCRVSAHMRRPVIVLGPDEEVATAAEVMRRRRIKRLPVVQNGRVVGIVSLSDIAALAADEAGKLASSLNFFTAIVGAQAAQHSLPKPEPVRDPASIAVTDATNGNGRDEMLDIGGPG
jgi:signal-transduction protein with cAMP-binding, CBS, and nucleotidyltransferase domain